MQPEQGAALLHLPMLIFFIGAFYFMIIRPSQKREKEHKLMLENIKKNDQVVTAGGIHGTVVNVKEKTFVVRIDDNVKIEIDKVSINQVEKKKN